MSLIVQYSTGSTYTLVASKVEVGIAQDVSSYHVPRTNVNGAVRNGLKLVPISITGDIVDRTACLWHDIQAVSFDSGTSYQTVYFASASFGDDRWSAIYPFTLELLASPLKEQTAVRYPTGATNYKWGLASQTLVSQAGNTGAPIELHYLAPLFYFPLQQDIQDFAGRGLTFTRALAKAHGGVSYGINSPIFDNGIYIGDDTSQDTPKWTPAVSTLKSIACQIKQTRYPSSWLIGTGSPTNLVTNGEFETDVGGWGANSGSPTRDVAVPIIGTGSLKYISTGGSFGVYFGVTLIVGHTYYLTGLMKSSVYAGGRKFRAGVYITGAPDYVWGTSVDASATAVNVDFTFTPTNATCYIAFGLDAYVLNENLYLDSVVLFDLTAMNNRNLLTANQSNAETDTTGMTSAGGTFTRTTTAGEFYAGTAGFKNVSTGSNDVVIKTTTTAGAVAAGEWYNASVYIKATAAAGRTWKLGIAWYTSAAGLISTSETTAAAISATFVSLSLTALAPASATSAYVILTMISGLNAEVLFVDNLMLEAIPPVLTVWTAALNKLTINTVDSLLKWTDDTTTVSATFPTASYMAGTIVDVAVIDDTSHAVTVAAHAAAGAWTTNTGTLAAIAYPELILGNLDGSIANLIEYPYALLTAEYQAPNYSLLPLLFNTLYIANNRAEEIIKQTDGTLETATGTDISGNLAGADILITSTAATITMSQGLAARWYLNVKRTDV